MKADVMLYESVSKPRKIVSIYSLFVAMMPVFASYASGIPGLNLSDLILIFFTGYAWLLRLRSKNNFLVSMRLLYVGIFFILVFNLTAYFNPSTPAIDITIRTIRYVFYMFCFLYTSRKLIDTELLRKYVKTVAMLATAFIILQFVLYKLGNYVLPGYIRQLNLYIEQYSELDYDFIYKQQMYRPTSFFLEPAHYARYVVIGLIMVLFNPNSKRKEFFMAIFLSVGVLISTSSQGYLLVFVVWAMYALLYIRNISSIWVKNVVKVILVVSPILFIAILNTPMVKDTLSRTLSGGVDVETSAIGARLGGFLIVKELSAFELLFGHGFGSVPEGAWLSSALYWIYGSGLFVFLIFVAFLLYALKRLKGSQKVILLCYFLLFFTDDSFYNYMCILFFSCSLLNTINKGGKRDYGEHNVSGN